MQKVKLSVLAEKRRIIRDLKNLLEPIMWESGYSADSKLDGDGRLKIWYQRDKLGEIVRKPPALKLFAVNEFGGGFYSNGVCLDAWGGGLVTQAFSECCLEDLLTLRKWLVKQIDIAVKAGLQRSLA